MGSYCKVITGPGTSHDDESEGTYKSLTQFVALMIVFARMTVAVDIFCEMFIVYVPTLPAMPVDCPIIIVPTATPNPNIDCPTKILP